MRNDMKQCEMNKNVIRIGNNKPSFTGETNLPIKGLYIVYSMSEIMFKNEIFSYKYANNNLLDTNM